MYKRIRVYARVWNKTDPQFGDVGNFVITQLAVIEPRYILSAWCPCERKHSNIVFVRVFSHGGYTSFYSEPISATRKSQREKELTRRSGDHEELNGMNF